MQLTKILFGTTPEGEQIYSFQLQNDNQMLVSIIEYGAVVAKIMVPDKNGEVDDVVLGFDDLQGYIDDSECLGATIGRVAGRIGGAGFSIDGNKYKLSPNTLPDFGRNHLHGGAKDFNNVIWKGETFEKDNIVGVELSYYSEDGEEGYPGNMDIRVKYSLNNENELSIDYFAVTDKPGLASFTHHGYFNLAGEGTGTVLDQKMWVNADKFTVEDDDMIPTGEILNVKGLPVDFTSEHAIGSRIDEMQMAKYKGYDLNYILNHKKPGALDLAAKAIDTASGRVLEVYSTQPCIQLYTANSLEDVPGKGSNKYSGFDAFCLEPQGYPDAPNHANFLSVELRPGEKYRKTIVYKFLITD